MDHGRILALDTPAALKDSVGAGTVVRLSVEGADVAALGRQLVDTVEGVSDHRIVDGALSLSAHGSGLLPRIIDAAERAGAEVTDVSVSPPTLETVFINLTGKDLRE
jgi:ABC-2 type transport system ATP-binding protein